MELHFTAVPSGISIKNRTEIWFLQIHPEYLSNSGQIAAASVICLKIRLDSGQKYSILKSIRNSYQKPDRIMNRSISVHLLHLLHHHTSKWTSVKISDTL